MPAGLGPDGAEEGGDCPGALVFHFRDDGGEVDRPVSEAKGAAGDRRDERDLVSVRQLAVPVDVGAVDRVDKPGRLVAELQ